MYRPEESGAPESIEELFSFVMNELWRVSSVLELYNIEEYNSAPEKPFEGMIVIADGTNWNPGSGAGYYGYRAGAWRKLEN